MRLIRRYTEGKQISVVIDSEILLPITEDKIKELRRIINELGVFRSAKIIFDKTDLKHILPTLQTQGFEPLVVVGDKNIHLALETIDQALDSQCDVIIVGGTDDSLSIVLNKAKIYSEVYLLAQTEEISKNLSTMCDGVIIIGKN